VGFFSEIIRIWIILFITFGLPAQAEAESSSEWFTSASEVDIDAFKSACALPLNASADEIYELEFHYMFRDTSTCGTYGSIQVCRAYAVKKNYTECAKIPDLGRKLWGTSYAVIETLLDLEPSLGRDVKIQHLLESPHRARVPVVAHSEFGEVIIFESKDDVIIAQTGE
jgi:hypothetical protein